MHLIEYLISSFKFHRARYLACILGFSVAIGTIFSISGYVSVLDAEINKFYMVESNSFMVVSKGTSILKIIPFGSHLPENTSLSLQEYPGIVKIIPVNFKNFDNVSSNGLVNDIIIGIENSILKSYYLIGCSFQNGTWPDKNKNEVIIGNSFGEGKYRVGDYLEIRNTTCKITGILNPADTLKDRMVFCDYNQIQQIFSDQGFCTLFYIVYDEIFIPDEALLADLENKIIKENPKLATISTNSLKQSSGNFFKFLEAIQAILGVFPFIISLLFVFVLLLLNVKDHQREFGILRAIGISQNKIALMIFLQTMILICCSYLLGIVVGMLLFAYSFFLITSDFRGSDSIWEYVLKMNAKIEPTIYGEIFILIFIIGLFISLYPMIIAARVNIIKSIRSED